VYAKIAEPQQSAGGEPHSGTSLTPNIKSPNIKLSNIKPSTLNPEP